MKLLIIFLLSFVIKSFQGAVIYAPEMRTEVLTFLNEARKHNIKIDSFKTLTIRFSKKLERMAFNGFAPNIFGEHKLILINPYSWGSFSPAQRMLLIAHEMGHSLLKRAHEVPHKDSIMRAHAVSSVTSDFMRDNKFYWDELFSKYGTLSYISDQWDISSDSPRY